MTETALQQLGYDLEGYKEISSFAGIAVGTIWREMKRDRNPFPVRKFAGRVYAKSSEVLEWTEKSMGKPGRKREEA